MKHKPLNLAKLIGEELDSAEVSIFFHGTEKVGSLLECGLKFASGKSAVFYCKGNGEVGIIKGSLEESKPTRDEQILLRNLQGLSGHIRKAQDTGPIIVLEFDAGILQIKNEDDEMAIEVDGIALKKSVFAWKKAGE